jgi:hypothetical protein
MIEIISETELQNFLVFSAKIKRQERNLMIFKLILLGVATSAASIPMSILLILYQSRGILCFFLRSIYCTSKSIAFYFIATTTVVTTYHFLEGDLPSLEKNTRESIEYIRDRLSK